MDQFSQSINQFVLATTQGASLRVDTLNATPAGSTNDAVLRFDNAQTVTGFTVTTAATTGTEVKISQPGVYLCVLQTVITGAVSAILGITLDGAAGSLTGNPAWATAGTIAFSGTITGLANLLQSATVMGFARVTSAMAASASLGIVRFNATDGSNATISSNAVAASTSGQIFRIGPAD